MEDDRTRFIRECELGFTLASSQASFTIFCCFGLRARADLRVGLHRLGLGASATALHMQQAEEAKLRQRLSLPQGKKRAFEGEDRTAGPSVEKGQDSDDDEESRSKVISRKVRIQPALLSGKKLGSLAFGKQPLFNPTPSPSKLDPSAPLETTSAAPKSKKGAASPLSNGSTSTPSSLLLTKNQRRKVKDKEKIASMKRAKMQEMRAEEKATAPGEGDDHSNEDDTDEPLPTPISPIRRKPVKPPFAPLHSPSIMSSGDDLAEGKASPAGGGQDDEVDSDDDMEGNTTVEPIPVGTALGGAATATGEGGKKKKRRRPKKSASAGEKPPLLNLAQASS